MFTHVAFTFTVHSLCSYLCLHSVQNPGLPIQKLQDIQRAMELLSCQGPAKSIDEATKHKYQFWDTQPVPKLSKCLLNDSKQEHCVLHLYLI